MRSFIFALFAIFVALPVHAHDHDLHLKAGQWVLDYNPRGRVLGSNIWGAMDYENEKVVTFYNHVLSGNPNPDSSSDQVSLEFAPTDGVSVGIRSNLLLSGLVWGFRDAYWSIQGSVFSNVLLAESLTDDGQAWRLFWHEEVQLQPIFTNDLRSGDGKINLFSNLSYNLPLVTTTGFALSSYIDAKLLTCFPNPGFLASWENSDSAKYFLTTFEIPYADDLKIVVVPTVSAFVAVGVETLLWNSVNFSIGTNIPLGTLITLSKSDLFWDASAIEFWNPLNDVEFQLKWVL